MEIRVAQSFRRNAVKRRGRDHAAKCARRGEADIVGHNEQDVGRALRRHHTRRPIGFRLRSIKVDLAPEGLRRRREIAAVDRRRCFRRPRYARDRLCRGTCCGEKCRHGNRGHARNKLIQQHNCLRNTSSLAICSGIASIVAGRALAALIQIKRGAGALARRQLNVSSARHTDRGYPGAAREDRPSVGFSGCRE